MKKCQSCGMPLTAKSKSKLDKHYCIYCQNQDDGELATYQQVKEGSIKAAMRLMKKTKKEAIKMAEELLPKLPRWKKEKRNK